MAAGVTTADEDTSKSGEQPSAEGTDRPEPERIDVQDKKKKITTGRLMRRVQSLTTTVLLRSLDAVDCFIKLLGPLFMLLAFTLFSFETYTYFTIVLPNDRMPVVFQVFVTNIGIFLLANLIYNYVKAICTDPGLPPDWDDEAGEELMEAGGEGEGKTKGETVKKPKRCQRCLRQKPARTHHCSVCKRCVLKMDHHCPWINNCVGYHNYRYFCLFLFYLALSCAFVMIMFFDAFLETMMTPRRSRLSFGARQCVSLCWIIATCILFALFLLGGFHVYLVLTNQTTIEFHTNLSRRDQARRKGEYFRNPYDLGRVRNFKQVFGPSDITSFWWALSFLAPPPIGDGLTYPTNCVKAQS